jgi:hypothetical protein
MASSVPQEILSLIAQQAARDDGKLTPYTLVNRAWQAAFERQIYTSLVVLSPSEVTSVSTGPDKRTEKRGLSLKRLDEITSGPQDWRRVRRTHVRQILYRVAVPYWLIDGCEKGEEYTYDNVCRRQNDYAFTQGVRSLFRYLSTWTNHNICLSMALQAENVSTDEDDGEPHSLPPSGDEDAIAPYCADFLPVCVLPCATCITSLDFPEILTPAMIVGRYGAPDLPCPEDRISLPAVLKIASACGTLRNINLDNHYNNPSTEPEMGLRYQIATAHGLDQLPSSIRNLKFRWISPSEFEIPDTRSCSTMPKRDAMCVALHKVSMQLEHLCIEDTTVFPELFGEGSIAAYWPHLETLRLDRIDILSPLGGISRYADGSTSDEILTEHYIDDLYTSLGYAAQSMPNLKRARLRLTLIGQDLEVLFRDNQWIMRVRVYKHYKPSPQFLEAWKVPGGELQPCSGRGWQQAIYTSWPPS